jgi:hypothetical protein
LKETIDSYKNDEKEWFKQTEIWEEEQSNWEQNEKVKLKMCS